MENLNYLEIDTNKIRRNLSSIRKTVNNTAIMAMVKDNAYGLGLIPIARVLAQSGVNFFGVATIQEALSLRQAGIAGTIVIMCGWSPTIIETAINNGITLAVFTQANFQKIDEISQKIGKKASVWIKVDTGLGRLGLPYLKTLSLVVKIASGKDIKITGLYSTLTEDPAYDRIQLRRLKKIITLIEAQNIAIPIKSLVSSASILSLPEGYFNLVRAGIMLYGIYPSDNFVLKQKIPLQLSFSWKTKILQTKRVKKGAALLYRRALKINGDATIAVLPVGYTDGLDPKIVNGGKALVGGQKYPFVGLVTMNNSFLKLGRDSPVKENDEVVLIGTQKNQEITIRDICQKTGRSQYQLLGMIPEKVERRYLA
ncbi:alanine racemase [candidate division WWE3 bacterium CG06_land_8_20_14_3_00_42_16]|uniref:Alanine racemase n=4 Tax=Katanobacteria TaxID=422282 RepID=A0A2M7ALY1_UNCKA|nr:MAG: alanine racemase [bacterium CG1_02_42_9]PIU68375.1 MAG: alanine racemase [candidate division WWE3 bacterium CG06_land_8_20_14_3_00_42_16]PIZ43698.1 MAG: alanine racemase [candidate division WWE3 bacterium CG_4_10_14_0_2_um_filter_42_8]PJA37753.1 MAG: alanine racemase [candidate division WWE3 bacterium CG_4_9_14_3_um_filter_43_9]PJC68661.1 MAG: alanine racemase [candidate division WWE3 bacterium CG_4_8_14_3_um_filter_42_11]